MKIFAYNKIESEQKIEICFRSGRKHCEKGENAVYQHFLLFPHCFQKAKSFLRPCKSEP